MGKLEIWYGTASGKTTLLNELIRQCENSIKLREANLVSKFGDLYLIILKEPEDDDKGEFIQELAKHIKPNVRYVLTTNTIYPWMLQSRLCEIMSFPHRFY
jgi:hypothetical protein